MSCCTTKSFPPRTTSRTRARHQMREMARALGCTYGYIAQLRSGHRKPEHIGQEFADKVDHLAAVASTELKECADV